MNVGSPARLRLGSLLALATLLLAACGDRELSEAPLAGGARLIHEHRDPRFDVTVETRGAGAAERMRAEVVPLGDYHLSLEYPARLALRGSDPESAVAASERSEAATAFELDLAQAGVADPLAGTLRFGVCLRDELCEAVSHEFEAERP
jgi:hypothetical protein